MNADASAIVLRREALQRRCAAQREQLTDAINAVESRLHEFDRATIVVRKLRLAPVLLAVIAAAIAATPLMRTFSRGLSIANLLGQLLRSRWLESVVKWSQKPKPSPEQQA